MPTVIEFPLDTFIDVFGSQSTEIGTKLKAPGGASLTIQPYEVCTPPAGMTYDNIPIIPVLIEFGTKVAEKVLFSNWLEGRVKSAPSGRTRLKINRQWTEFSKDGIVLKTINESIELESQPIKQGEE